MSLTDASTLDARGREPPLHTTVSFTPTISSPCPRTPGRRHAAVGVIVPRFCMGERRAEREAACPSSHREGGRVCPGSLWLHSLLLPLLFSTLFPSSLILCFTQAKRNSFLLGEKNTGVGQHIP